MEEQYFLENDLIKVSFTNLGGKINGIFIKNHKNFMREPLNLINKDLLNQREVRWLNNYHKKVYKNIKKYMSKNEILELNKACSSI